jgi:hypothetical protein
MTIPTFSFLKKPKILLILLLATFVVSLSILRLLKRARPALQPISPPPPAQTSHSTALIPNTDLLRGKFSSFPKSLPVYQIGPFTFNEHQALALAQKLGFNQNPTISSLTNQGKLFNWGNEESYLSINSQTGAIDFGQYPRSLLKMAKGQAPSPKDAQNAATKFLKENQLEIPPASFVLKKSTLLAPTGSYLKESSPDNAPLLALYYEILVSDIKIFLNRPEETPLSFVFDSNLNIISFNYFPPFKSLAPPSAYPLKTEAQVLSELKENFKIDTLSISEKPYLVFEDYQNLSSVGLSSINLVYYSSPPAQTTLPPVFIIKGAGVTKENQKAETTTFLPAISSEYLTSPAPSPSSSQASPPKSRFKTE